MTQYGYLYQHRPTAKFVKFTTNSNGKIVPSLKEKLSYTDLYTSKDEIESIAKTLDSAEVSEYELRIVKLNITFFE